MMTLIFHSIMSAFNLLLGFGFGFVLNEFIKVKRFKFQLFLIYSFIGYIFFNYLFFIEAGGTIWK